MNLICIFHPTILDATKKRNFEADDTDNIAIAMAHESRHHESILDQEDNGKM
jgi:hypothetical protein